MVLTHQSPGHRTPSDMALFSSQASLNVSLTWGLLSLLLALPPFSLRHLPLTLLLQNRAVTVLISRRAAPPASLIAAPAARSP